MTHDDDDNRAIDAEILDQDRAQALTQMATPALVDLDHDRLMADLTTHESLAAILEREIDEWFDQLEDDDLWGV